MTNRIAGSTGLGEWNSVGIVRTKGNGTSCEIDNQSNAAGRRPASPNACTLRRSEAGIRIWTGITRRTLHVALGAPIFSTLALAQFSDIPSVPPSKENDGAPEWRVTLSTAGSSVAVWFPLLAPVDGPRIAGDVDPTGETNNARSPSAPASYNWVESLRKPSISISHMSSVSPTGKIGGVFASRTSDTPTARDMGTIGIEAIALNDSTVPKYSFAIYGEAYRMQKVPGASHVFESDSINFGDVVDVWPSNFNTGGTTDNLWVACGGGYDPAITTLAPCSMAMGILRNGAKFRKGIVFGTASLDGADATKGQGVALAMSRGHRIDWYSGFGTGRLGYMFADGNNTSNPTGVKIDGAGLLIGNADEVPIARFNNIPGARNFIETSPAEEGRSPNFRASGADRDVSISISGKGRSGVITNIFVRDSDPTAEDLPSESCSDWRNTAKGTNRRWCNFGGKLKYVEYN